MAAGEYEAYYAVIRSIPRGRVMTYGDVARAAGFPRWARRVGYALSSCNDATVPWWRVINAEGRVSRGGGRTTGADEQEHLLRAEGIPMKSRGAIDLGRYRFRPDMKKGARQTRTPSQG